MYRADSNVLTQFLDTVLHAEDVLRDVLLKLDSNALDKVTGVRKGLFAYIGGHWNGVDCDDEETIGWLLPILRPLAEHVGQFYTEKYVQNSLDCKPKPRQF